MRRRIVREADRRRAQPQASPLASSSSLAAPAGLTGSDFRIGDQRLLVLSFPVVESDVLRKLSPAERDVATCVARGDTNAAIARLRRVSVNTIAKQVATILRKTETRSRFELI